MKSLNCLNELVKNRRIEVPASHVDAICDAANALGYHARCGAIIDSARSGIVWREVYLD